MTKHQRHVVHGDSALHITMQQLDAVFPGNSEKIYTWLACRHCAQVSQCLTLSTAGQVLFIKTVQQRNASVPTSRSSVALLRMCCVVKGESMVAQCPLDSITLYMYNKFSISSNEVVYCT